jgi:prepilin-type N-terminal cleavage/methylation domain-containing protein
MGIGPCQTPTHVPNGSQARQSLDLTRSDRRFSAFTLVEVMVGVAVMALMLVALYGGFVFAFAEIRLARENVRATQILQEKMEVVRLYNWDQINQPGFIPTSFSEAYYVGNPTNTPTGNFSYAGTVLVTNAPITETYSGDLRMVQIQVSWKSGNVIRKRKMITFVSQYGLQKYVY